MLDDFQDDEQNKGSDFLDDFRQHLNSQPLESLEERKNDINRSQHIFLGSILGVGLAAVVSWLILSPEYNSVPDAEIPVIRRPHSPVKIQPADPGGMEILNQDKTIYDIVEKKDDTEIKVENLLPPPEEPIIPDIENKKPEIETATLQTNQTLQKAEEIIRKESENKITTTEEEKNKTKTEEKTVSATEEKVATVQKNPKSSDPTPVEEKTVKIEKTETSEKSKPSAVIAEGNWQIQLISSPNKAAMEKAWNSLVKKYSDLKDLPHEVESADLGSKGTFYRLKAGAFKHRTDAEKICNTIKSSGGSCLVKKKQ